MSIHTFLRTAHQALTHMQYSYISDFSEIDQIVFHPHTEMNANATCVFSGPWSTATARVAASDFVQQCRRL